MCSQARNNRKTVRPTPAVPNTTCVISRSLTAMMTLYISLPAELVCSTERARRRSKNSKNALRGTNLAAQIFRMFYSGYSKATNSLITQSGLLQKQGQFINTLFFSTQAGFILSIIPNFLICLNYSTT